MSTNLTTLAQSVATNISNRTDQKISTASTNVIQEVRDTVVEDVVQNAIGVDLSGLATKTEVATKADTSAVTALSNELALKANVSALDSYVTTEQLTKKKYATESYVASKALTTAVDIVDAGLAGSFASIWKNYNPDNMAAGNLYVKQTNSTDNSFSLIDADKNRVIIGYNDQGTGNDCTITIGKEDGNIVIKNQGLLGTQQLIFTPAGIYWPISGAETYTKDDMIVRKEELTELENRIAAVEDAIRPQETEDLGD